MEAGSLFKWRFPSVLNLAEETGLSTLTIQKILKAKEILGDTDFTSQDLADILHITLRSANRMLDNMVRYHMAALLYHRQKEQREDHRSISDHPWIAAPGNLLQNIL